VMPDLDRLATGLVDLGVSARVQLNPPAESSE